MTNRAMEIDMDISHRWVTATPSAVEAIAPVIAGILGGLDLPQDERSAAAGDPLGWASALLADAGLIQAGGC